MMMITKMIITEQWIIKNLYSFDRNRKSKKIISK